MSRLFYVKKSEQKDSQYMLCDKEYLCLGAYQMDVGGTIKLMVVGEDRRIIFVRPHDVLFERLVKENDNEEINNEDTEEINSLFPPPKIQPTKDYKGKK